MLGKVFSSAGKRLRLWVQVCFTALTNGYAAGFFKGKIYTGSTKATCRIFCRANYIRAAARRSACPA